MSGRDGWNCGRSSVRSFRSTRSTRRSRPASAGGAGKECFTVGSLLLAWSERLVVATGIANIHARDPMAAANGARALGDAFPGRFVLGLGVSHAPSVAARGGTYERPLTTMREYLD